MAGLRNAPKLMFMPFADIDVIIPGQPGSGRVQVSTKHVRANLFPLSIAFVSWSASGVDYSGTTIGALVHTAAELGRWVGGIEVPRELVSGTAFYLATCCFLGPMCPLFSAVSGVYAGRRTP